MKKLVPLLVSGVVLLAGGGAVALLARRAPADPAPDAVAAEASASPARPSPPPPRKTEPSSFELDADERSRAALAEIEQWRTDHASDLAGALERYKDLAKRFPETEVAVYATRACASIEERLADQDRAAREEAAKKEAALAAEAEARRRGGPAGAVPHASSADAKAAALAAQRVETELRDIARSGRLDDACARARELAAPAPLTEELARLAAGRDALRAALVEVEGERVESFDEARLAVKTKKREVALARLTKAPKMKPADAASAAEFLLLRGAGATALLLAESASASGELLERARAAAREEKGREAAEALDAAIASGDAAKLRAAAERWKQDPAFAARKDAWKDAFTKARTKVLQTDPAQFFRAAHVKTLPGGVLSITYDWKDARSALDWIVDPGLPNSAIKLDTKRGQALVEGHVRNPARFVGKVRVRATLTPTKGATPNASLLLHDQGGWDGVLVALGWDGKGLAKVAIPKNAPSRGGQSLAPPVDAVVLPLGAEKSSGWKIAAAEPAEVCALGARLRLDVVKDDKVLSVRANGAPLFEISPAPLPGQVGGVGFVPDSSTIVLHEVAIEGKLEPEWHQTAAAERARAEADELVK